MSYSNSDQTGTNATAPTNVDDHTTGRISASCSRNSMSGQVCDPLDESAALSYQTALRLLCVSVARTLAQDPDNETNIALLIDLLESHSAVNSTMFTDDSNVDPVTQRALTSFLNSPPNPPSDKSSKIHVGIRNAAPCERSSWLVAMVQHMTRSDQVGTVCTFIRTEIMSGSRADWVAAMCTSAVRDGFFIPLAAVAKGTVFGVTLANLAAAVFVHTPAVSIFATANMRDNCLLPLGRQEVQTEGSLPFILRALKRLSACDEGQRILTCKAVRNFFVRYATVANSRSLIAASAALRQLTDGRKDDPAARKIFATPTFRDEFFLPLVRVASNDEHVFELASTLANIAAMDPKIFATSATRDRFFIPLAALASVVSEGDAFAGTQRLSDGEFYDKRCAVTSLMAALECTMAREHRSVFATGAMYRHFFVPLAKTANSVGAVTILLRQFGDLTLRVPAERAIAEEIVTAVAEYATTLETASAIASIVSTHA